ncbi:MAG: PDDEXK nuclease domain-containing protein [Planctomycetota bacterium]
MAADSLTKRPEGYEDLLRELKERIRVARVQAALAVNRELVLLYWTIGRDILERQERLGWGAKVIEQLAADLRREFPGSKGFSSRNLKYMRSFAQAWPDEAIVQGPLAQITWWHNLALLEKVKDPDQRLWYARKTVENGWSRNALVIHIERELFEAKGSGPTNFDATLPAPQSDLARETLKDPYKLDFLGIAEDAEERVIEQGLVRHIRDFLIELGKGFAFVGNQVPLEVGGEEFRIDLLFYHLQLRCFIVIELKAGKFKPEHMGKLNFYLSAVDDLLRHQDDQPSIGLVLCKDREDTVAEYALRGTTQPMAVSQYELTKALPENLKDKLPSVEDLEAEMEEVSSSEQDEIRERDDAT